MQNQHGNEVNRKSVTHRFDDKSICMVQNRIYLVVLIII